MNEFYRNKKVLVTGHTGFKGSWLCQILSRWGAKVTGYSLKPPTDPSMFDILKLNRRMDSVIGDIRDLDHLKRVFEKAQPEFVFHLAAQPIVRESYADPVLTYETNVMGTVNVLECIRQFPCVKSFVNVTTDKVYENKETGVGYRETDPLDGYDPYSNSKSCSELVTHSYKKSFFQDERCRISTARAGNVIGGGDFANDRIIPDCIRAVSKKKEIVVRNPDSVRPYQHVMEPLSVYLTIAMKQYEEARFQGYYNVGPTDRDCVTTGLLVDFFCEAWGEDAMWVSGDEKGPHEAGLLKLDCSLIKEVFGWTPRFRLEEAMKYTVDWSKAYLSKKDMVDVTDLQVRRYFDRRIGGSNWIMRKYNRNMD